MSHKTSSDVDFTKQKQAIELHSTADNSNQTIDLINTLLGMKSLIAQFKQQSSEPSQARTSNNNNKDSRKKVDKGNLGENSQKRSKGQNDDDVSIHASWDEIKDNNVHKNEQGSNVSKDHDPLSSYSSKVSSDDDEYSSDHDERSKVRYQDLLDSILQEMSPQIENKFAEVFRMSWGKAKPKGRSCTEYIVPRIANCGKKSISTFWNVILK